MPCYLPRLLLTQAVACVLLLFSGGPAVALESTYDAPLPAQLSTDPDLCAYVPCQEVLPGADSFSVRKGRPSYVEGYRHIDRHEDGAHDDGEHEEEDDEHHAGKHKQEGDPHAVDTRNDYQARHDDGERELAGYVFLSTDIVDIPAYSGKPVVTLIGMDARGIITGIRILRHSEPILLVGIPESELTKFTDQYVGKFVGSRIEIGKASEGYIGVDAISGATVTVIAENQVIMRSGYEVARQVGILQPQARPQARFSAAAPVRDWAAMLKEGSVQRLTVKPAALGMEDTGGPFMDMYFGYLNTPGIGPSILGEDNYRNLMAELKPGEHAIFIVANGTSSFKGSGFVRGGIFDRIQIAQDMDTFTFRDSDYLNLYGLHTPGAPAYRESGIFIVRDPAFSAAYPWSLVFLASRTERETGARSFATFDREYWLPARYLEGGRPAYDRPDPPWLRQWRNKGWEVGGFLLILALTTLIFINRDKLVRASTHRDKFPLEGPKYLIWTVSIIVIGGYALAQPSITQVLTWFHSLIYDWRWELFLTDPFIFIFWWFIIITVFVWGRGLFCGWLCPYGALTEVVHNVAGKLGLRRWQFYLPRHWHERLKWLKYYIFAGLLALSFYSLPLAEQAAEIEPFKTTFFIGVWDRTWPFALYWWILFIAAFFMERPFCKYLCPLGAALAIPTTFRLFGLRRKRECETCKACAHGCTQLAIDSRGRINQRECLLCMDCMVLYYDTHACPPLSAERKARAQAGLPLTRINVRGYYEPLTAAPAPVPRPAAPAAVHGRLWEELYFHLFPWGRDFGREIFAIRAIAALLVVTVTTAWLLAATQRIGPVVILSWWLGWSVYELMTRMHYKPQVKDGPWWGSAYRQASFTDMLFYVMTKNLLIAAVLFLLLNALGILSYLQHLPALTWLLG